MSSVSAESVTEILTAAAAAPSGDNSQPWRFVVRGSVVEFHYAPERDNALLNFEEGGTLIALGAALENAELAARAAGYATAVRYPDAGSCVAELELGPGGALREEEKPLASAILSRHTNRKAYRSEPLDTAMRSALAAMRFDADVELALIEDRAAMRTMARALTTMEETALGNEALHELFFGDIFWSDADNAAGVPGLHIKTLELPPPARALFRVLKHWRVARALAKLGFPRMVADTNALQNASASALGILTAPKTDRRTYLAVGRALERVWLLATARGYAMQIVTGLTFLARSAEAPVTSGVFSAEERDRIAAAYAVVRAGTPGAIPVLAFRVGKSSPPTAVSHRRAPDVTFA